MRTSDDEVAEKIIAEFRKNRLLSETGIQKISQVLVEGRLSPEDWRLVFEVDRPEEGMNNGN
jgi:hypothetical protein